LFTTKLILSSDINLHWFWNLAMCNLLCFRNSDHKDSDLPWSDAASLR